MAFPTFPSVIPTSQPQASALLSNAALNAGLTNLTPFDRLTNLEQVVGNILLGGLPTNGGIPGGALTGFVLGPKAVTAITDNTATTVMTITAPNVLCSALIQVTIIGIAGAGGAIGAGEDVTSITYNISVTRTPGVAMAAVASTGFGSAAAAVTGAGTMTTVGAITLTGEGVTVTNTAVFKATIDQSSTSSNHVCLVFANIVNWAAGGITIS